MDIFEILEICKKYSQLGWACQEQLDDMLNGKDLSELNSNAVRYNIQFLNDVLGYMKDDQAEELEDILLEFDERMAENG